MAAERPLVQDARKCSSCVQTHSMTSYQQTRRPCAPRDQSLRSPPPEVGQATTIPVVQ